MREPGERLRKARLAAGFKTLAEAARYLNMAQATYYTHEQATYRGDRKFNALQAEIYARKFKTTASWLLTGEGVDKRNNIFKVVATIGATELIDMHSIAATEEFEEIELPFGYNLSNVQAMLCNGHAFLPRVRDGEAVIFHRDNYTVDDVLNQEAIVGLDDGRVLLKTVKRGSAEGLYRLESHNFPTIEDIRINWVAALLAIIPPGQFKKIAFAPPFPAAAHSKAKTI